MDNFEKVYFPGKIQITEPFFTLILLSRPLEASLSFFSHVSTAKATWIPGSSISTGSQWALTLEFLLPHDLKPYLAYTVLEPTFSSVLRILFPNSFVISGAAISDSFHFSTTPPPNLPYKLSKVCNHPETLESWWFSLFIVSWTYFLFSLPLPHHLLTGLLSTSQCFN